MTEAAEIARGLTEVAIFHNHCGSRTACAPCRCDKCDPLQAVIRRTNARIAACFGDRRYRANLRNHLNQEKQDER